MILSASTILQGSGQTNAASEEGQSGANQSQKTNVRLYTTRTCPQCSRLKSLLKGNVEECDLGDPDHLTNLRVMGIFAMQAPILVLREDPVVYLDAAQISTTSDSKILSIVQSYI